jgi:hypothetical protein
MSLLYKLYIVTGDDHEGGGCHLAGISLSFHPNTESLHLASEARLKMGLALEAIMDLYMFSERREEIMKNISTSHVTIRSRTFCPLAFCQKM